MIVATASITCPGTSSTVEQLSALRRASGGFVAKRKQWLLVGDTRADDVIQDTFVSMSAFKGKADMAFCEKSHGRLSGVKRTCRFALHVSACNPKRILKVT